MTYSWKELRRWPEILLESLEGVEEGSGVARITMTRPEKHNCLNGALMAAFLEAMDIVRADKSLKVVITKGAGPSYSSGLDLHWLDQAEHSPLPDWDTPAGSIRLVGMMRDFPRIMIAQVHGYCFGGSMAIMNSHDIVIAAEDAQIGMPEVMRGSFGQIATATLVHSGIPIKKAVWIQLTCYNVDGKEADRQGIVSKSVPAPELEDYTTDLARELAGRPTAALEHAKIAVSMGRNMSIDEAVKLDLLVGNRQQRSINATGKVSEYLKSQKGGPNTGYVRKD